MPTVSKLDLLKKCTHYLKAKEDRYPPFIFTNTYMYFQKINEKAISPKPNIYMISFKNASKLLVKAHRMFEQSYFTELKSCKIIYPNSNDIDGLYLCVMVSDGDIDIPAHLTPLQDQMI